MIILFFLGLTSNSFAEGFYQVDANINFEVTGQSGKRFLRQGDLFQVVEDSRVPSWAIGVRAVTPEGEVLPELYYLGKRSFDSLNSENQVAPLPSRFRIAEGRGSIEAISERGTRVVIGSDVSFTVTNDIDGWKQRIEIVEANDPSLVGTSLYVGQQSLKAYLSSDTLVESLGGRPDGARISVAPRSAPVPRPKPSPITIEPNQDCRAGDFELQRLIFMKSEDQNIRLPSQTQIKVSGADPVTGVCLVEVINGPFSGKTGFTYPSNLSSENIVAIENAGEEYFPGQVFVVSNGSRISSKLIGGEFGVLPTFFPMEVLMTVGNRVVLKDLDGKLYTVEESDLNNARRNGHLAFDHVATAGEQAQVVTGAEGDQVGEAPVSSGNTAEKRPCPEVTVETDVSQQEIFYEVCRSEDLARTDGSVRAKNDHWDEIYGTENENQMDFTIDGGDQTLLHCIQKSMKKGLNRNVAPNCQQASGERIRRQVEKTNSRGVAYRTWELESPGPRACASESLSVRITKEFERAMNCLDIDPKEIYPMIHHESRFQPGAISPTGALGMGQLLLDTYSGWRDDLNEAKRLVTENHSRYQRMQDLEDISSYDAYERDRFENRQVAFLSSELDHIFKGERPECQEINQLADEAFPPAGKSDMESESLRVCPPQNPFRDFVVAGLNYRMNKKYAGFLLRSHAPNLDPLKVEEWSKILAQWMHNGGTNGISSSFEYFVGEIALGQISLRDDNLNRTQGPNGETRFEKDNLADFTTEEMVRYLSVHIHQSYGGSERRKDEVSLYYKNIEDDLEDIEKGGLSCD